MVERAVVRHRDDGPGHGPPTPSDQTQARLFQYGQLLGIVFRVEAVPRSAKQVAMNLDSPQFVGEGELVHDRPTRHLADPRWSTYTRQP